jgi:hypothetical protein
MTEPSQSIATARFDKAHSTAWDLAKRGELTYRGLEDVLTGLTLEQRLEIKRGLAQAGLKP